MLRKVLSVPVLLVVACLFAGLYGALHNQISCTVSPEYFTAFKFHQFHLGEALPLRGGAAVVGFLAAWWMGIVIGIVVVPFGLRVPGTWASVISTIKAFAVVALTALAFGLGALLVAFVTVGPEDCGQVVRYGNQMVDDVAFTRAGAMHNFSYLGGLAGIVSGCAFLVWERRRALTPAP